MPNEPLTTIFDEDLLSMFLGILDNPYAKNRDDLVQSQEANNKSLQIIVHNLLDIPNHTQPLFPLHSLLTEPRVRHLTCE